jgi:phage FluMu protein Com
MKVTASPTRHGSYTQPHRCRQCSKTFWGSPDWNRVTVVCPHCKAEN